MTKVHSWPVLATEAYEGDMVPEGVSVGPGGPRGPRGPGPGGICLSVLGSLGTLGSGVLARDLALVSICRVADSRCATWEAMIVEAVWSRPFSVYSRNTSSKSRSLDCSSRGFVRV